MAFQGDAFQNNAFQVPVLATVVTHVLRVFGIGKAQGGPPGVTQT